MRPLRPQHRLTQRGRGEEEGARRTAAWALAGWWGEWGAAAEWGARGCRAAGGSGGERGGHESSGDVLSFRPVGHLGGSTQVGAQAQVWASEAHGCQETPQGTPESGKRAKERPRKQAGERGGEGVLGAGQAPFFPAGPAGPSGSEPAGRGGAGPRPFSIRGLRLRAAAQGWHGALPRHWGARGVFQRLPSHPDAGLGPRFLFRK